MKEIKYDPNVITQEMIVLRAREICCRGAFEDAYPLVNQKINELNDLVTYLAIKELKEEMEQYEENI